MMSYRLLGGMPVAIGRDVAARRLIRPLPQPVPAGRHRLDPFGLAAQGDARHAVEIGLLLQPARIGEDGERRLQEAVHVEIAERLAGEMRPRSSPTPRSVAGCAGAAAAPPRNRARALAGRRRSRPASRDRRCSRRDGRSPRHSAARRAQAGRALANRRASAAANSVASYITSPMSWTPRTMPSRRRLSTAVSVGHSNRALT